MPRPKVGDTVTFYFMVERRLQNRAAVITRTYPESESEEGPVEAADLEVGFTPAETQAWGYAPVQRHKTYAAGRRPISGEWQVQQTFQH